MSGFRKGNLRIFEKDRESITGAYRHKTEFNCGQL